MPTGTHLIDYMKALGQTTNTVGADNSVGYRLHRLADHGPTSTAHPHALIVHPAVQLTASLVLQVEGVKGSEEGARVRKHARQVGSSWARSQCRKLDTVNRGNPSEFGHTK